MKRSSLRTSALLGVARRGEVDDATFNQLAKFFNPQEIVEITITIGTYTSNALLTRALRIKVETDGRGAAPGQC